MKKPNIINKAWNLTKSIVDYAKSGFEDASQDKYKERLTICGCIMSVKAKWDVEKCPENKW